MIPFLDLKAINAQYRDELVEATARVIDSGWYIGGNELATFEQEFAAYCSTKHAIGVANGLDALILTLRAWKELGKLKDGDEVIVPSNTYIASILAISANNLTPVLVEPDLTTCSLTLSIALVFIETILSKICILIFGGINIKAKNIGFFDFSLYPMNIPTGTLFQNGISSLYFGLK